MQSVSIGPPAPVRIVVAAVEDTVRDTLRGKIECEPRVLVVGEAPDSQAARALILRLTPDLLVIECEMNRELAAHRSPDGSASGPPLHIIVLLASAEPQQIVEAFELGAKGVVLKDCLPEEWRWGIERVIAGQYWIADESIAILLRAARQFLVAPESAEHEISPPATLPAREFGLTPRETEIARKIAVGQSNRELGQEFSICERTVKHHLTNIFRKTGVSSRLALALLVRDAVGSRPSSARTLPAPPAGKSNAV